MIAEAKEAVRTFADAGLIAASHDLERGGIPLPLLIG